MTIIPGRRETVIIVGVMAGLVPAIHVFGFVG